MNNDQRLRGAQAAAMLEYLDHVDRCHSDVGFSFKVGPTDNFMVQQLREAALRSNLVCETIDGLELTASGRFSLNSAPRI